MTPPALALRLDDDAATCPAQASRALRLGLAIFAVALPLLVLTQYMLPAGYEARYWGLNPRGLAQFHAHFGLDHLPSLAPETYSLLFRASLLLLWSGYALALLAAWQGASLRPRPLAAAVLATAVATALFAPPLLSTDVYAYAAHGRLFVLYGQSPYQCLPMYLARVGDPVAHYLVWNWPTVYGPVWTRIEIAVVGWLHTGGLWPQVVGLKLVEAIALAVAALAGRRITQIYSPGRENLTLLAIGLNPLLMMEGPGSGHNDLLMISFLLVGAMFYCEKKYLLATMFLGLSVGIKLVTLAVLPWAVMEYSRGRPGRQRVAGALVCVTLIALILAACYGSLWTGASTLVSAQQRAVFTAGGAALVQDAAVGQWLRAHHAGAGLTSGLVALFHQRLVVAVYGVLTVWLWRRPAPGRWLVGWGALSVALMFFALGVPFPWYLTWVWPICLLRWDRLHLSLSAACFCLSLVSASGYGLLVPSH